MVNAPPILKPGRPEEPSIHLLARALVHALKPLPANLGSKVGFIIHRREKLGRLGGFHAKYGQEDLPLCFPFQSKGVSTGLLYSLAYNYISALPDHGIRLPHIFGNELAFLGSAAKPRPVHNGNLITPEGQRITLRRGKNSRHVGMAIYQPAYVRPCPVDF